MMRKLLAVMTVVLTAGTALPVHAADPAPAVSAANVFPLAQGQTAPAGDLVVAESVPGQLTVGDVITFRFRDFNNAATLHLTPTPAVTGTNGLKASASVASTSGTLNDLVNVTIDASSSGS